MAAEVAQYEKKIID